MARVNVDSECFSDTRFVRLARALGMGDPDTARMKCVRVWHECTLRGRPELSVDDVDMAAGVDGFAAAMVTAELAKDRAGARVYVCGTKGRIEWFQTRGKAAKKGGEATRKVWKDLKESNEVHTLTEGHVAKPPGRPSAQASGRPSSSASSSSSSASGREELTTESSFALVPPAPPEPKPGTVLRAAFESWYAERYGQAYAWSAREGKNAKDLMGRAGALGAPEVLRRAAIAAAQEWRTEPVTLGSLLSGWNGVSVAVVSAKRPREDVAELERARRVIGDAP